MNNEEKVAGKHYDFEPVNETIELIELVVERGAIPRKSAYMIGTALKYIMRAGTKPNEGWEDDVAKAMNYLHRALKGEWVKQ